jgi:protein-L-isoaspartate(D-aspartate) O-methyltransferase
MNIEQARFNMVEQQIRPWNVLDADVLSLLSVVKREDFVPVAYKAMAFTDMEIPLGHGQCMLAPRVEARLLQDIAAKKHEKVLEIGAGSGYMTALLAHRAQHVVALEINPELAAMARTNLAKAGIHNAEVQLLDGSKGAPAEAPFDAIVLNGSVAEVPPALLAQLKVGGRLIAVVGNEPMMYTTLITRTSETDFKARQVWDTVIPRLLNFTEPSQFKF